MRRGVLWPCNLTCRGGDGRSVARAGGGGRLSVSGGISETTRGTLECIWIPGQQARVVVALGRWLRVFVDYLCGHALKSTRSWLGRVALDARLGLSVDERRDWGELGVVGVVDCLDPMLLLELIRRQRRASDRRHSGAFRTGRLGGIHERKLGKEENRATDRVWNSFFLRNQL